MNENKQIPVYEKIGKLRNDRYIAISRRYSTAMVVMFLLSLIFFVCAVTLFGDYITTDNIKYVARDWNSVSALSGGGFTEVIFTAENNMTSEYFRGGLSIAGNNVYKYYDNSGAELFTETTGCTDPVISSSSKYLLLYDKGGTSYSVYNQLTRIITRETEEEILSGDICDNGAFVLVTRSESAKYEVHLFNSALNEVMKIPESTYIIDAAVSQDGQTVVTCAVAPSSTNLSCVLEIRLKGTQEPLVSSTIDDTMPLSLTALDECFVLLCDNGVYYYKYSGELINTYQLSGSSLSGFDISDDSAILYCSLNALGSENRLTVLDAEGEVLSEQVLNDRISGVYASVNLKDSMGYYTTTDKLVKITPEWEKEEAECSTAELNSVIPLEEGALVVFAGYAYPEFTSYSVE